MTVEVIPSRAYFIGLPSEYNTTNGELAVSGCSTAPQETVTVYKISPQNPNMYTEQQAYKVVVANSRFYTNITLPEKGEYLITVANCSCHISYN